jgi:hypothetical protein
MARGRLLKTKVKEAKKIAYAAEQGRLSAQFKTTDKHFWKLLKQKILESASQIDPLELAAVGAMTLIIAGMIKNISKDDLEKAAQSNKIAAAQIILKPSLPIARLTQETLTEAITIPTIKLLAELDDPMIYLVSFLVAYVVVHHAGEIMQGAFNLGGWLVGFLGLAA